MKTIIMTAIIIEVQKELVNQPYDLAHDITHHYRVFENCMDITRSEKLKANLELLTLSAWVHDLGGRRGEDEKKIKNILKKGGCESELIIRVIQTIHEHSFGTKQHSLESQILFDADKLEYVHPIRLGLFLRAVKDGYINRKRYIEYKNEWKERINKVEDLLHFPYSKHIFSTSLSQATKIMT